jgi:hypothetical protein
VDTPFFWIQPHVLERLRTGQFVPQRSSQLGALRLASPNLTIDRRAELSPLAVAKRCIKYQPLVFLNRLPDILHLVEALNNNGANHLLTLEGPSGSGKTALMRGVIELMGGGPEQLLWLSLTPLSDPLRVLHALAQQLLALTALNQVTLPADPLLALTMVLGYLPQQPLVVVVDNLDCWMKSHQLKQSGLPIVVQSTITALLGLPQLKVVLIAPVIPTNVKRLGQSQQHSYGYYLPPLAPQPALALLNTNNKQVASPLAGVTPLLVDDTTVWPESVVSDWGLPACLQLVGKLHRLGVLTGSVSTLLSTNPSQCLPTALNTLWVTVGQASQLLLLYLACLPVGLSLDAKALWSLLQTHPSQEVLFNTTLVDGLGYTQQLLKAPLLSPLVLVQLLPQQALLTLQAKDLSQPDTVVSQQVGYQLHPLVHQAMASTVAGLFTIEDQAQCHLALAGYYLQQVQALQQSNLVALQWCYTTPQQLLTQHRYHKALAQQYLQVSPITSLTPPVKALLNSPIGADVANWSIKSYLAKQ